MTVELRDLKALESATKDALGAMSGHVSRLAENVKEHSDRLRDVEQNAARRPGGFDNEGGHSISALADLVMNSEGFAAFKRGHTRDTRIDIPRAMFAAAITESAGAGSGTVYPVVAPDRRPGIAAAPTRRLTIRDLFTSVPTNSNMIEFTKENVFTNNAGPQYDASSPTPGQEGAPKNESGITFVLDQEPVTTIAHWVPASKQILDDAPGFARYIEERLIYGLKLEEEDELLNGDGTLGNLNGLLNQATPFTGGVTNQTLIDTLAKAAGQLVNTDYEPSGFVLNSSDWLGLKLLKDTNGRYLLGDPAAMTPAVLWGLPVVATPSMTAGTFICLDARRAGYIADREGANIQVSDSHADFFTRNLVAIRCEERLAFVVERTGAIVKGSTSYAG